MFDQTLFYLFSLPAVGAFIVTVLSEKQKNLIQFTAVQVSVLTFLLSLHLLVNFDYSDSNFQFVFNSSISILNSGSVFNLVFGIDGISILFVLLTTFLTPLCLIVSIGVIENNVRVYTFCFLIMEFFLLITFTSLDLIVFYVFFEAVLIPMFILVNSYGSRSRRVRAAYLLFLYTLVGSIFMLLAMVYLINTVGSSDIIVIRNIAPFILSDSTQNLLQFAFFLSFATKVPIVPFHVQLPEAHVEAPTAGSVVLAGILLKLGTYGLIRFSLPFFPVASLYFTPLVYVVCVVSVIYTALTALRQSDIKRVIAYASVSHMAFSTVGLFAFNQIGIEGCLLQNVSHGFVSGALFICVGVLYNRTHTRMISYYGGLVQTMPLFTIVFLFMTLVNIGLPGTSSFVGEFLILTGSQQFSSITCFFIGTSLVLGGGYSLYLYNRVSYGNIKNQFTGYMFDLNKLECGVLFPLVLIVLFFGVAPQYIIDIMQPSVIALLTHIQNCV